jgi:hypothetical protein
MLDPAPVPVLRLDDNDAITFASAEWLGFLRETGGPELTAAGVVGRPFSDFAPDPHLGPLYRLVFRRVRQTQQPLRVPFRLEAGGRRWHMDLSMLPLPSGEVECRYETVLVETPGAELLTQCAWCRRVHLPEGLWAPREVLSDRLDLFLGDPPRVTHGICPSCSVAFSAAVKLAK